MTSYAAFERTLTDRLGGGGQGEIFRIGKTDTAFKRYTNPRSVEVSSLEGLVSWYLSLPQSEQDRLKKHTAWPTEIKYLDDGTLAGFIMPIAPEYSFVNRVVGSISKRQLLELGMIMDQMRPAYKSWLPSISVEQRFEVIVNFLELVTWFHDSNLVLGDISGRNFAWRPDSMDLFFMDCDAYLQVGKKPASPQLETPAFHDPDPFPPVVPGESKKDSDNYKVSLVVMRLMTQLMNVKPDGSDEMSPVVMARLLQFERQLGMNHLEWRVKELWKKAGSGGGLRPTPSEWLAAFRNERGMVAVTPPAPLDPTAPRPRRPREYIDLS